LRTTCRGVFPDAFFAASANFTANHVPKRPAPTINTEEEFVARVVVVVAMDCPSSSRCDPFVAEDALVGQKQHPFVATDVKNDRGIFFYVTAKVFFFFFFFFFFSWWW
jgi:hypothetical protein